MVRKHCRQDLTLPRNGGHTLNTPPLVLRIGAQATYDILAVFSAGFLGLGLRSEEKPDDPPLHR